MISENPFKKRLCRLRATVEAGEGSPHLSNEAEKVRLAVLAAIKARYAL